MAGKLKTTGFTRFFIFLIIAAPLIYSAAALIKGENPLDAAQRDLGINFGRSENTSIPVSTNNADEADMIEVLKSENRRLGDEILQLKAKLRDCE